MKPKCWYERYGFAENPLSIKPQQEIVGREQLAQTLLDNVKAGTITAIVGEYGYGKTSLLKHIIQRYKGKRKVAYFSCNRLTQELDLERIIHERYGALGRILKITSRNLILLLDEVEHLKSDDFKHIYQYFTNGYFHTVVLVTNNEACLKQSFEIERVYLDALQAKDAVTLIQKRLLNAPILSEAILKKIYEHDKRIRKFLQNTERVIKYKIENEISIKPTDISKILQR